MNQLRDLQTAVTANHNALNEVNPKMTLLSSQILTANNNADDVIARNNELNTKLDDMLKYFKTDVKSVVDAASAVTAYTKARVAAPALLAAINSLV